MLHLAFNESYSGDVDHAAEAIRPTRQLTPEVRHEEIGDLIALMLLQHAWRPAPIEPGSRLVPLAEQDRSLWNTRLIFEGVDVLQAALARDDLGGFLAQAAIAALLADARTIGETDWMQMFAGCDRLVRLSDGRWPALTGPTPSARLDSSAPIRRRRGVRARA